PICGLAQPCGAVFRPDAGSGSIGVTDASSPEVGVFGALDRRGVATLTLNRPEKGNRYNQAMLDTLLAETTRLGADPAVRVIVLRAGGKHFCVGAEIGEE